MQYLLTRQLQDTRKVLAGSVRVCLVLSDCKTPAVLSTVVGHLSAVQPVAMAAA
jgi:hypothetical protein